MTRLPNRGFVSMTYNNPADSDLLQAIAILMMLMISLSSSLMLLLSLMMMMILFEVAITNMAIDSFPLSV